MARLAANVDAAGFPARLSSIRKRFSPGAKIRAFGRALAPELETAWASWESGHVPGEARLAAALSRLPGVDGLALARWALGRLALARLAPLAVTQGLGLVPLRLAPAVGRHDEEGPDPDGEAGPGHRDHPRRRPARFITRPSHSPHFSPSAHSLPHTSRRRKGLRAFREILERGLTSLIVAAIIEGVRREQ